MIFDLNMLKSFYDEIYAPALQSEENLAFLMALAARDKYALPGEDYVMSNRTEMLAREYTEHDDFDMFVAKLHHLVGNDYAYLDKNHKPIPEHLKVIYVSVNPVDLLSAYCLFTKKLAYRNEELLKSRNRPISAYTVNSLWTASMQTCPTARKWFDFDMDLKKDGLKPNEFAPMVGETISNAFPDARFRLVVTHGGVHMLASNEKMSKDYNPQTITQRLNDTFGSICDEIKLNKNGLIPCPGTMQGGVMVRIFS
ncbi:MAG: hypothetical protein ACI4SL_11400 [Candidatus Ornithospirochaeta sp.]